MFNLHLTNRKAIVAGLIALTSAGCATQGTLVATGAAGARWDTSDVATYESAGTKPLAIVAGAGSLLGAAPSDSTVEEVASAVRRALTKDAADGFKLADEKTGFKVQYTSTPLGVAEARKFDGLWTYDIHEDAKRWRKLDTAVRATQASGSMYVPDNAIVRNYLGTVEADLPVPAGLPAGSKAFRAAIELVKDPAPIRGTFSVDRVYLPAKQGGHDREIAQVHVSRDLRFATPAIPALNGQALVLKRTLARFIPVPTGITAIQAKHLPIYFEDVPLSAAEEQVWPDGTVIQTELAIADDLKKAYARGTLIAADKDRSVLRFERAVDLGTGWSYTTVRTLGGIVVALAYNPAGILASGSVRDAAGREVAQVAARSITTATLAIMGGKPQTIGL